MPAIQELTLKKQSEGRPSKLEPALVEKLIKHLSVGNYIKPSCEAAGIHYQTLRDWIARGEADKAAGLVTPHSELLDRLSRAQAEAEATIVDELRTSDDWRAKAFIVERRWRDRWGKDEQQSKAAVTINLPAEVAGVLLDALSVGAKHLPAVQVIDAECEPATKQAGGRTGIASKSEPDAS